MTTQALGARVPEMNELVKWQGYSLEAERMAKAISITDDEEELIAVDSLSQIKTFQKQTEEARKEHVDPFNQLVKRVNGMFKPISESLDRAEADIKGKIGFYRKEKERVRLQEEAKRLAEYKEKIAKEAAKPIEEQRIVAPPEAVLPASTTTRGGLGAASVKKFWNYEVTDIQALYMARPDLVELTERRREILSAIKDGKQIAGLRVFEDLQVAAR